MPKARGKRQTKLDDRLSLIVPVARFKCDACKNHYVRTRAEQAAHQPIDLGRLCYACHVEWVKRIAPHAPPLPY